jgi:hypothetical protein
MDNDLFTRLKQQMATDGVAVALDALADQLGKDQRYHELFDVRLMQCRQRLGLPIVLTGSLDELPDQQRTDVEQAYLEACREVGRALLAEGKLREAWMYLRVADEKDRVVEAIAELTVDDDNVEEVIAVALDEDVDACRGFDVLLEHYGTCNAITRYESDVSGRDTVVQQHAMKSLVMHLYGDLVENVRADIEQHDGKSPDETSLVDLITDRDWLFAEHAYHVDTTHLASVVRFARRLEDTQLLDKVVELTEYGSRLSTEFQLEGELPFKEIFKAHRLLFRAMLGQDVDEALDYFKAQAEAADVEYDGALSAEVYVKLLADAGRDAEAIGAAIALIPSDVPVTGFAPSLFELSQSAGNFGPLLKASEERGDLLGFVAGLVEEQHQSDSAK